MHRQNTNLKHCYYCICIGQRTAFGNSLPPCWGRISLFCCAMYSQLTGSLASRQFSCLYFPSWQTELGQNGAFFFFFEPLESLLSSAFPSPSQKSLCLDPTSHCSIDSLRSGKDLWGPAGMLSWTFRLQNKLWDVWVWSSSSHSLKGKTDITTCP